MINTWKVGAALACVVFCTGGLQAAALWNNGIGAGATQTTSGVCDANAPVTCGGNWTVFDNFTVSSQGWVVNGFDFTDFFITTPKANYTSTAWSIWKGDPLSGGTLVASGSAAATLSDIANPGACATSNSLVQFHINIASVTLASGTYYIGTNNTLTSGRIDRALGSNAGANFDAMMGWEQSQGSISGSIWNSTALNTKATDSSFAIQGDVAPEPGTWALMILSLGGLMLMQRRKRLSM